MTPAAFDPLIVALDVERAADARQLVRTLDDYASFYKVGLELFTAAGMDFVRELTNDGKRVFLDLKFYDIGETVKRATAQAARSGATFLTVHGSPAVMRAAIAGRGSSNLKLLAVTVLTSFDDADLQDFGYERSVEDLVSHVVRKAQECGMDGVVASAREASSIRETAPRGSMLLVTPGVRSSGEETGDQKRVVTPAEAMRAGSDYLVVGRQVTRSADPLAAIKAIREEIRAQ